MLQTGTRYSLRSTYKCVCFFSPYDLSTGELGNIATDWDLSYDEKMILICKGITYHYCITEMIGNVTSYDWNLGMEVISITTVTLEIRKYVCIFFYNFLSEPYERWYNISLYL